MLIRLDVFLLSCDLSVGNVRIVFCLVVRWIIFGKKRQVGNLFKLWFLVWLWFPCCRSVVFVVKFLQSKHL